MCDRGSIGCGKQIPTPTTQDKSERHKSTYHDKRNEARTMRRDYRTGLVVLWTGHSCFLLSRERSSVAIENVVCIKDDEEASIACWVNISDLFAPLILWSEPHF